MAANHRDTPIPRPLFPLNAGSYHGVRVNLEVSDAADDMVRLCDLGINGESYYCRTDGLNPPYYRPLSFTSPALMVRRGVAARLLQVNDVLRFYGLEIYVWDAFRPIACQRELWQYFLCQAKKTLPDGNMGKWEAWALKYCSDPSGYDTLDSRTWPTHVTGGAVDVTLRRICNGELLYMGGVFDDSSDLSRTNHFEDIPENDLSVSDFDARANRRMLFWTMHGIGFSNFANEWWHYDYGTQMWVTNWLEEHGLGGPQEAFYGPANI